MKKGFTLIELLAVIAILAIVLLIAVPKIIDVINNVKINAYKENEQMMTKAATVYMAQYYIGSSFVGSKIQIPLADLITNKLITAIKDPTTKNDCDGVVEVTETTPGNYTFEPRLNCNNNYELTHYTSNNIKINNSNSSALSNLKIYGNSTQSSIPSIASPATIQSVATDGNLKIISVGKNLWNRVEAYDIAHAANPTDNVMVIKDGRNCIKMISLYTPGNPFTIKYKPNTQYTINAEYYYDYDPTYVGVGLYIAYTDSSYNYLMSGDARSNWFKETYVTTANKTIDYIVWIYNAGVWTYMNYNTMSIYEGNTTDNSYLPYDGTEYNINLSNPLYSLPDGTQDYIDFSRGKIVHLIGKATFDGSADENWGQDNLMGSIRYFHNLDLGSGFGTSPILSNKFVYHDKSGVEETTYSGSRYIELGVLVSRLSADSVPALKTWLASNPVDILYKLKTPTEEDIALPTINTKWGLTNIFTKDTTDFNIEFDAYNRTY